MIEAVKKFIVENNLCRKKILIGLSGGVDSTVLCDILSKLKNEIEVVAIHLNHNWRGVESKCDEDFARSFANDRKIEFYSEILSSNVKKNETDAREARYAFFEKCMEKFNGDAVFLAHNKNDNIETLIYRLFKGTGPKGLISIPKIRDFYYRPLIDFSRSEIEKYAKENNIEFVIDKSNFDTKYKRNLIRQEILPAAKKINSKVEDALSTFILINKMQQKIIDRAIEDSFLKIKKEHKILRDKFLNLDNEIQYEILNRYLKGALKNRDFKTIERILNFIKENNSSKISIGQNKFLKVYNNKIYMVETPVKKEEECVLKLGENKFLNYSIFIEEVDVPPKIDTNEFVNFDFNKKYIIRTRKEGDIFQPFGSNSPQKLKTFFIKEKIPNELRGEIPLITLEDEILFISGVRVSEKLRVDKNSKKCYKISVKGDLRWN